MKTMSLSRLCTPLIALLLQFPILNAADLPDTTPLKMVKDYAQSLSTRVEGSPTELAGVIEVTGTDAKSIYQWVCDNIRFESYSGFRKGATGTLVSGGGNAADQSLLLASLLEYSGTSARLVKGRISSSQLPPAQAFQSDDTPDLPSAEAMETLSRNLGISSEQLYETAEGLPRNRQTFLERLWSRTLNDLETLADTMEAAGISVPENVETTPDEVDHWWVRTNQRNFDPVMGSVETTEGEAFALGELPDEAFHRLRFRMWIQKTEGDFETGSVQEPESVLDMTFHCSDLFGSTIVVGNVPLDLQSALSKLRNPTPDQVLEVLATAKQFQPQLITPFGLLSGHPFDKSGNKLQVKDGQIESVQKIGSSMGGLWGGMSGGDNEEAESHLVAHWVEIELIAPDSNDTPLEPVSIRRDILHHANAEKNTLEILSAREILVDSDELSSAWLSRRSLSHMSETAGFVDTTLHSTDLASLNAINLIRREESRPQLTQELYGFGIARKSELLRLRDQLSPKTEIIRNRPSVISKVSGFSCVNDDVQIISGLDILYQAFQVKGPHPKKWNQSLTFAAGILDTALELAIMEGQHDPADIRNASLELQQLLFKGGKPGIVETEQGIEIRMKDSETGNILAHYTVDPTTGMSLGMMDGGGQAMSEYAEYVAIAIQLRGILGFYSDLFRCIGIGITYPLTGGTQEAQKAFTSCVFELACGQITGLVGTFVEVDTCWTNVILQKTVDDLFGDVCSGLSQQIFN